MLNYLERSLTHDTSHGLERTRKMLSVLDDPHTKLPVIHVAGTNGKGSVCAFIGSCLQSQGYKVGIFTSPHFIRVNERIAINGVNISDEDFTNTLNRVVHAAESVGDLEPFFFQLLTVMAFDYFARCQVDFAIMETGIGGRLDVTNVIEKPVLSVITAISYDHMEILGSTLSQIASEKAGIIKEGCPVAVYPHKANSDALAVIKETALKKNAKLYYVEQEQMNETEAVFSMQHTMFSIKTAYYSYSSLNISILGEQQILNASLALLCLRAICESGFPVGENAIRHGLQTARWPGRFEVFPGKPTIVLDGAHNEDGALCFKNALDLYFSDKQIVLITGILKTKDSRSIMRLLTDHADYIVCTQPSSAKALPPDELVSMIDKKDTPVLVIPDPQTALIKAVEVAGPESIVAVAGSLYLIGDIMKALNILKIRRNEGEV